MSITFDADIDTASADDALVAATGPVVEAATSANSPAEDEDTSRWGLFTVKRIPDAANPDVTYLARLRILETPWFGLYLHRINVADDLRYLHNHPWNFFSLVLRGGYDEARPGADGPFKPGRTIRVRKAGTIRRVRRDDYHAITRLHRSPTWTLLFVGARRDTWGFATPDGWVDHRVQSARDLAEPALAAQPGNPGTENATPSRATSKAAA